MDNTEMFLDFELGRFNESLQDFKARLMSYALNSIPAEGELWTAAGVVDKINPDGTMKPFYGNTTVFPLGESDKECVAKLQDKLYQLPWADMYLAEKLEKDTFHITLHDLVNGPNFTEIEEAQAFTEISALKILGKVKQLDIPLIQMKPKYLFNLASTSLVLGFEPVTEQDCRNLFMLHGIFQSVVELSYPLTPHVTLAYFKNGKYKAENLKELRHLADIVNDYLEQDDSWVVTLSVKDLVYQRFYSMNRYRTIELNCL